MWMIIENQKKAEDYMNPGWDHVGLEKHLYEHLFGTAYNEYMRCALDGVEDCFNESPRKKAAMESHENAKKREAHTSQRSETGSGRTSYKETTGAEERERGGG